MKKIMKLTGVLCAVAMTAIMGFCALGEPGEAETVSYGIRKFSFIRETAISLARVLDTFWWAVSPR